MLRIPGAALLTLVVVTACGNPRSPQPSVPEPRVEPTDTKTSGRVEPATPTPDDRVTPAAPKPAARTCAAKPNPAGCPASEPNIAAPCTKKGLECTYGTSCCPPVYVCNQRQFEAHFQSCPK
ncbi:MAG: hypothetical protein H0T89_17180 [Deltaproteobacteria bacterium]|nr:hypothetical protein [Deltaproteobacteria bacterium]MDQ3294961.1 hypothetical protein [Myxococcota bacterium]